MYKSRNIPSVLFRNSEMSRRYRVQIQKYTFGTLYKFKNVPSVLRTNKSNNSEGADIKDVQNKIKIWRLCAYLNLLGQPKFLVQGAYCNSENYSAGQKLIILWKPYINHSLNRIPVLVLHLIQWITTYTFTSHFFKSYLILSFHLWLGLLSGVSV